MFKKGFVVLFTPAGQGLGEGLRSAPVLASDKPAAQAAFEREQDQAVDVVMVLSLEDIGGLRRQVLDLAEASDVSLSIG